MLSKQAGSFYKTIGKLVLPARCNEHAKCGPAHVLKIG
jgi:chloramphenicol O-acetyltransferase